MATNTIKYSMKVGNNPVTIEAEGFKALMLRAGFLAEIPNKCGNCKSTDIVLNGRKVQGYDFFGVICRDCKHELKCGQLKEGGGLFWKHEDGWVAPYKKEGGGGGRPPQQRDQRPPADDHDDDDIPF